MGSEGRRDDKKKVAVHPNLGGRSRAESFVWSRQMENDSISATNAFVCRSVAAAAPAATTTIFAEVNAHH